MGCPGPELLAAMAEGRLDREERDDLTPHLADCDTCRHGMLAMLDAQRGATAKLVIRMRRPVPWGAIAAALLLGVIGYALGRYSPKSMPVDVARQPVPAPTATVQPLPESPRSREPAPSTTPEPTPQPPPSADVPPPVDPPDPTPPKSEQPTPPSPKTGEPPAPTRPEQLPAREVASVRLLDVTGELTIAKKRVAEGQLTNAEMTAVTAAAFRVDGDLIALAKGTVAAVGKSDGVLSILVQSGEACVESDGARWQLGGRVVELRGRAIFAPSDSVVIAELPQKEAARRLAPFKSIRTRQQTWYWNDFAEREKGMYVAPTRGPLIVGTIDLDRRAPYASPLTLKLRARTNVTQVQVNLLLEDRAEPQVMMATVKRGAWQDLSLAISRFETPTGAKPPEKGARIRGLLFLINPADAGKERAFLELDDVLLLEKE